MGKEYTEKEKEKRMNVNGTFYSMLKDKKEWGRKSAVTLKMEGRRE